MIKIGDPSGHNVLTIGVADRCDFGFNQPVYCPVGPQQPALSTPPWMDSVGCTPSAACPPGVYTADATWDATGSVSFRLTWPRAWRRDHALAAHAARC